MTENKGIMLVVSGPAGSGKGTVNAMLLKRDDFAFSVSATTRAARPGEVDGINYHFITREGFIERINSGDML
jgi:guanylate kinase